MFLGKYFVLLYFKLLFLFIISGAFCFTLFLVIISFYFSGTFVLLYSKLLFLFIISGAFCFTLF